MLQPLWKVLAILAAGCFLAPHAALAQEPTPAQLISRIDAAVQTRFDNIASYTVTEHYSVFRNGDLIHPAAEMTVKTTYKRETGKSYQILTESGSEILRRMVLRSVLSNEQEVNRPGVREGAFFTSSNYRMTVKPGGAQQMDGRSCYAVEIQPKPNSQHLVAGTLWADAANGQIVQVEGKVQKGLSLFTGAVQVFRKYASVDGFAQATYARAESNSVLLGRTVVTIDYRDYQIVADAKPATK
jgi:hypothetical protein